MRTVTSVIGTLAIVVALSFCATTAKGETSQIYTEFGSFDLGTNSQATGSISVPQFNPALGTLVSVVFNASDEYNAAVTVSGPGGAQGAVTAVGGVTIQDPGNYISSPSDLTEIYQLNYSLPSVSSGNGGDISGGPGGIAYDSPAVLSEFTGNGNVNFQVTEFQYGYASDEFGGDITFNIDGRLSPEVDVTYNYTVPEPGSVSLLVVGFGIMLARRKVRNRLQQNP